MKIGISPSPESIARIGIIRACLFAVREPVALWMTLNAALVTPSVALEDKPRRTFLIPRTECGNYEAFT